MKFLVILTGGTIGSLNKNNIIDTNLESAYSILNMYYQKYGKDCIFDVIQPFSELSEDFTIDTINSLSKILNKIDYNMYSGVIITHGSDTVAYTSSFISYMYCDCKCPIVFIASDYPPEDIRSNALKNLRGAIIFLKNSPVKNGVFFSYANPGEQVKIYLGTRINEADCFSDKFTPFGDEPFAYIADSQYVYNESENNPTYEQVSNVKSIGYTPLKSNTLILKSYTGMDYRYINLERDDLKSVINIMYHSSTACTTGEGTSFIEFIKRCTEKGIKIYCVSFKNIEDRYVTSEKILNSKAIPLLNISHESAYAKAVISGNIDDIEIMKTNIFFEHI